MRTWYVDPELLDDKRVLGQHREIHALLGSIMSQYRGYQNHPVTKLYKDAHLACLVDYHKVIEREMLRRGWTGHKTPVSLDTRLEAMHRRSSETCYSWTDHVDTSVSKEELELDSRDLWTRWTSSGKFLHYAVKPNEALWFHTHYASLPSFCSQKFLRKV